jgi:antitoxin component of MazEF toxin-antitoxin module
MAKKVTFIARLNANLGVRIPEPARTKLKLKHGSAVTVTLEEVDET